jgi:Arc/MetJ family transcription regulator
MPRRSPPPGAIAATESETYRTLLARAQRRTGSVPPESIVRHVVGSSGPAHAVVPYSYGTIVCMKKTLHIDERLLREARIASGAGTDTDTVRLGLEALVRRGAYERLRALRGSEPRAHDTPRRRARVSSARRSVA